MAAPKITVMDLDRAAKLTPTPGQEAFIRVAFDGETPTDTAESVSLWGKRWPKKPSSTARKVAVAVAGRGSGKTLLGALRAVHLALTVDISNLRRREDAFCPVIAPDTSTDE